MNRPLVVDAHAHFLPANLPDMSARSGDPRWPSLKRADGTGRIMCGDKVFRTVRPALWDTAARVAELDAAGVDVQVVSPVPITLAYWAESKAATTFTRAMNDGIAAEVAASGGRLAGLGAVALQDVDASIKELTRVVTELGLAGVEIGTVIGGTELDDPRLRPFFAAAQALDAVLFVHPMDGGSGVIRRSGQPYDFGLAMLTDTAIAATGLVFGGVLEEFPRLRIMLAHGCGTFAWAYPRLRMAAAHLIPDGEPTRIDTLVKSLWVDTLVFDPAHLGLLASRFGNDHIVIGTDHPFVPGQLEGARGLVDRAVALNTMAPSMADSILGGNARSLFKLA